MSEKYYRFFGGLLTVQENWLNKMAKKGYRLIRTDKMTYEFEKCATNQVQYRIEFVGQKSRENAEDYRRFLEEVGYKVFYKNINLNYSIGKVRFRPWAEKGGRVATNKTTFNRELFIVEKENDGKPFALHTSYEDKKNYYENLRNPWIFIFIFLIIFAIVEKSILLGIIALLVFLPIITYQKNIIQIKKESKIQESNDYSKS